VGGKIKTGDFPPDEYGGRGLTGVLDNIRIYNRVLSPTELGQLYVSESPTGRNLLVNGGFENSPNRNQQITNLDPQIDGWSSSTNAHMTTGNQAENSNPQQGSRLAVFNNGERSPSASIQQDVQLTPGGWYRLSYWTCLAGLNADNVPGTSALKASILQGGVTTSQLSFAPSPSGTWIQKAILFQASSVQATVKFEDVSTATVSRDIALDSVELVQINANDPTDTDGVGLTDAWERGYGRYQIVPGNFTWEQAKADAEARGGHLATVTSSAERNMLYGSFAELSSGAIRPWLGGTDKDSEGNWRWITGETWGYAYWYPQEPNNYANLQHYLWSGWGTASEQKWDDWYPTAESITPGEQGPNGYVLEFGYPTDPTLSDTDGDGFDDKSESLAGTDPNDPSVYPQAGVLGNSLYVRVYGPDWDQAEQQAVRLGGHLVKIDSANENAFLVTTFQPAPANAMTAALPTPVPAPVTMAILELCVMRVVS
jgi:hypothetical protein